MYIIKHDKPYDNGHNGAHHEFGHDGYHDAVSDERIKEDHGEGHDQGHEEGHDYLDEEGHDKVMFRKSRDLRSLLTATLITLSVIDILGRAGRQVGRSFDL